LDFLEKRNGRALVLFSGDVQVGKWKGKKVGQSQCGSSNWCRRDGNWLRWGRMGKEIGNQIGRAWKMGHLDVELREERDVMLLAGVEGGGGFGKGCH
jgi:hypothetical protein